jgi:hypothetical protein
LRVVRKLGELDYDMALYRSERHHWHVFHLALDGEAPNAGSARSQIPATVRLRCAWSATGFPWLKGMCCPPAKARSSAVCREPDGMSTTQASHTYAHAGMMKHMRTTMNLPDALMTQIKEQARSSGRTVTSLVEQALMELLERARSEHDDGETQPFDLPTYGRPGGQIFVDLSDNEAVRDAMDDCA